MEKLKELLSFATVSGREYEHSHIVKKMFEEAGAQAYVDRLGNIIGIKKSKNSKYKLLLDGHIDTIGLMVSEITQGGFVKFVTVGGVDLRILPSLEVTLHGKNDIRGVIGVKPPHLITENKDKPYKIEDLFIDTGIDKEELEKKIEIGDLITFHSELTVLKNNQLACAGLDDKVGVYVVYQALSKLKLLNTDVYAVATIGEEIGLKGAKVLGNLEDFDLCVAIDVTHGITPDAIKERAFELSKGAVVTISPSLSKKYNQKIMAFAKERNLPIQIEVETGNTGTNAWAYHSARSSNPTVMISVPLKYMHTASEVVCEKDIESAINLICGFVTEIFDQEER